MVFHGVFEPRVEGRGRSKKDWGGKYRDKGAADMLKPWENLLWCFPKMKKPV